MVKPHGKQPLFLTVDFDISNAIANLNPHVKAIQNGKELNDLQVQILEQVWVGAAYKEIAETLNYDADYIKRIAAQLWKLLSKVSDQKITKSNICSLLERYAQKPPQSAAIQTSQPTATLGETCPLKDAETRWVGREEIIPQLCAKLQSECYFLTIAGLTGVGKSSLAMRLILDPSQGNCWAKVEVICCDRTSPNFDHFAQQILGEPHQAEAPEEETQLHLLEVLQKTPYLIVLDMVEELLISDGPRTYRYQDSRFLKLFEQLITLEHCASRFIFTSQIHPPSLALGRFPHREHLEKLAGLSEDEVLQLFQVWEIPVTSPKETDILLRFCSHIRRPCFGPKSDRRRYSCLPLSR